jgi:hypothetical protein
MVCIGVIRRSSYVDEGIEIRELYGYEHSLKTISYNNFKREEYRVRAELHLQVMIDGQIIFQNGNLVKFPPTISSP